MLIRVFFINLFNLFKSNFPEEMDGVDLMLLPGMIAPELFVDISTIKHLLISYISIILIDSIK